MPTTYSQCITLTVLCAMCWDTKSEVLKLSRKLKESDVATSLTCKCHLDRGLQFGSRKVLSQTQATPSSPGLKLLRHFTNARQFNP